MSNNQSYQYDSGTIPQAQNQSAVSHTQKLIEKFTKSLAEFNQRRGLSLSDLTVNNTYIHPYRLYALVKKCGGLNQTNQNQQWPLIAKELDLGMDVTVGEKVASQYSKYIHPFELHLQSQSVQQLQQGNQDQSNSNSVSDASQPSRLQEHQRNFSNTSVSSMSSGNTPAVTSDSVNISKEKANSNPSGGIKDKKSLKADLKNSKVSKDADSKIRPKPHVMVPTSDFLYLPQKHKIEYKGGYDVQVLSRLGTEVDALSPEFPLFQELGTVHIHSITFALKSQSSGEIRQALDKLALVSSNPSQNILLQNCPGLGDALGSVGLDLLQTLLSDKQSSLRNKYDTHKDFNIFSEREDNKMDAENSNEDEDDDDDNDNDLITSIFNEFKSWNSSEKDIQFHVDSLTGDPALENDNSESIEKLNKFIQEDDNKFDNDVEMSDKNNTPLQNLTKDRTPVGFPNYLQLLDSSKDELDSLNFSKHTSTQSFWEEVLLDRLICVTMILRNLSFTDTNQSSIVNEPAIMKFIFGLIRSLAEVPNLIHLKRRQLSIHKDLITLLANLGLNMSFPSRADAFCVLLFILSFSPESNPFESTIDNSKLGEKNLFFGEYNPLVHKYLGCAVDAFAKLIPCDPPNRQYLREIFLNISTDEEYLNLLDRYLQDRKLKPYEFLTDAFVLVTSTLPRSDFRVIPKALEARTPLLQQSLLVAESLVSMIPEYGFFDEQDSKETATTDSNEITTNRLEDVIEKQKIFNVAFSWLEAVIGFGPTLLRASCVLGAVLYSRPMDSSNSNNPFAKFTRRSASILKSLGQKAMTFEIKMQKKAQADDITDNDSFNNEKSSAYIPPGILPTVEALFGALLTTDMNETVISQLCQLWEEGDDYVYSMMQHNKN